MNNYLNTLYSNFFKAINIKSKRKSRHFNSFLLKKTGYTFSQFSDAFSVASLFLILIKLLLRINGENSTWQLNLLLLLVGLLVSLKFNFIKTVRSFFRNFWKKVLGLRYYFYYEVNSEALDKGLIYLEHDELLASYKIPAFNYFNYFFHHFLYFLLLIRLFILSEPLLFIFFNIFLTYFLIVNKYLLLSSLFSFFLAFSRFTLFLADHNHNLFNLRLSSLIKNTGNDVLTPTYENAVLMGIIVTRFLFHEGEKLEYFEKLSLSHRSGLHYHKVYLADKILLLDKKRTTMAKSIHTLKYGEEKLSSVALLTYITQDLKEEKVIFFKKKKQNEYFLPVMCFIISFWFFLSPVNPEFNQNLPKVAPIVENLRRFFNFPISGKPALSLREQLAADKKDAVFIHPRIANHPSVGTVDENGRVLINNLSTSYSERIFIYLKKIPYFQNLSVVRLGETFQGTIQAKDLLTKLPEADSNVQQVLNNNLMVYHDKKLEKRFLEVMNDNDREDFALGLKLFRQPDFTGNAQHEIYSYLVTALLDPRNSVNDVKQLIEIKEGFEKYAYSYDSNFFHFSNLVKQHLPEVTDYYNKEDNVQLSLHCCLLKKFLKEMSKTKNPTIIDEIQIFARVYNKDPQEVLKEYENLPKAVAFNEIQERFLPAKVAATSLTIKDIFDDS